MAQLASLAALAGAGISAYGQVRQAQQQRASSRAQAENLRAQQAAQDAQATLQAAVRERERAQALARTIASVRARLAAGGVAPDEGSAAALAAKMVASVRRIVERHPLCRHLPPRGAEAWAADRFTVAREGALRDPSVLAQGIGGNVTGNRAEVIVCDDVEVAGNCDTPAKRAELRERLAEAEFILVPGGTILFVGTPHCEETLYRDPKEQGAFLSGYRRLLLPVMNAAGASAWPERFPRETIAALRDRVGPTQFRRQMLLQPVPSGAVRLDPAAIVRYAAEPDWREAQGRGVLTLLGHRLVSGGAFWDPSYGRPDGGDASVLACCYADGEGRVFLHRLAYLVHDPAAEEDPATQQCRAVARLLAETLLPAVRVETNGLGIFLPALLRRVLAEEGVACTVIDHASSRAKEDRILAALEPRWPRVGCMRMRA